MPRIKKYAPRFRLCLPSRAATRGTGTLPFELHSFVTLFPLPFVSTLYLVQGEIFSSAKAALVSLGLADEVDTSMRHQGIRRCATLKRKALKSLRLDFELPCESRRRDEGQRLRRGPHFLLKEKIGDEFPSSPFGLIEELLCDDPWKILLGCIMLNQTRRSQVGLGTNHVGVARSVSHELTSPMNHAVSGVVALWQNRFVVATI